MSKKHFIQIANLLRQQMELHGNDKTARSAIEEIGRGFAKIAKQENSRFQHARFFRASGIDESAWINF